MFNTSLHGKGVLSQQMGKELLFQKLPRPAEPSGKGYSEMLGMFLLPERFVTENNVSLSVRKTLGPERLNTYVTEFSNLFKNFQSPGVGFGLVC